MEATAASGRSVGRTPAPSEFGPGRLFVADSRLALALLNHVRHRTLNRLFGVSPEHANLVTFVLALTAADATYAVARRAIRVPVPSGDAMLSGVALGRAAVGGLAGPQNRDVPDLGALVALGVLGGLVLPELRRAANNLRAAERRVRLRRMTRYRAAMRAAGR